MPAKQRLKVYRTAIGFDDAYVAAPSQKAALAAWGADSNLFGLGMAEVVTDPELTAEPLAAPGTVIRRRRGDLAQHLAAAGRPPKPKPRAPRDQSGEPPPPPRRRGKGPQLRLVETTEQGPPPKPAAKPKAKPKPPPSRARVADVEVALAAFDKQSAAELAELRRREEALRKERQMLEKRHGAGRIRLERAAERAKEDYEQALERWLERN